MRQTSAILLLGLLLFNFGGYRLFTHYQEERENSLLEARLDDNRYDESQLILFKIPVSNLAYYNSSSTFERINGEVEVNHVTYKFVKRRLLNDSLELLCVPNHAAMNIKSAKDEFFKLVNDLQAGGASNKSDSHKNTVKVFTLGNCILNGPFELETLDLTAQSRSTSYKENLPSSSIVTDEQPPDFHS